MAWLLDFLALGALVSRSKSILLSIVDASLLAMERRTPLSDADRLSTELPATLDLSRRLVTVSMSCWDRLVPRSSRSAIDRLLILFLVGVVFDFFAVFNEPRFE